MNNYLKETPLLNYHDSSVQALIKTKKWLQMQPVDRVQAIYNYVRDDIKFGYNSSDTITAAQVLKDGYGQCNTKATLLMALLRAVGIPNRIHGFTIDKALQKGAITGIWYTLSPKNILHSWVEVYINENWYFLEGVILDKQYITKIQQKNKERTTSFADMELLLIIWQTHRLNGNSTILLFSTKESIRILDCLIPQTHFMLSTNSKWASSKDSFLAIW